MLVVVGAMTLSTVASPAAGSPPAVSQAGGPRAAAPIVAADASYLNPRLARTADVPGRILDVTANSLLYVDPSTTPSSLRVWDRVAEAVAATVPVSATRLPDYGRLTPHGVLFTAHADASAGQTRLFEWSGGPDVTDLGPVDGPAAFLVRSPYAIWKDDVTVYRRDLRNERTITVATNAWGPPDLESGGDVVSGSPSGREWRVSRASADLRAGRRWVRTAS